MAARRLHGEMCSHRRECTLVTPPVIDASQPNRAHSDSAKRSWLVGSPGVIDLVMVDTAWARTTPPPFFFSNLMAPLVSYFQVSTVSQPFGRIANKASPIRPCDSRAPTESLSGMTFDSFFSHSLPITLFSAKCHGFANVSHRVRAADCSGNPPHTTSINKTVQISHVCKWLHTSGYALSESARGHPQSSLLRLVFSSRVRLSHESHSVW